MPTPAIREFAAHYGLPDQAIEQLARLISAGGPPRPPVSTIRDGLHSASADSGAHPAHSRSSIMSRDSTTHVIAQTAEPLPSAPQGESSGLGGSSRYRDLGLLGRGGMAEVRQVFDRHLQRTVALKLLRTDSKRWALMQRRFLFEARLTGRLQHPGIPPVYDQGQLPDGRYFFTMPEIRGETLTRVLRRQGPSLQSTDSTVVHRMLEIFRQVCDTLAYAHDQGVIHRDLKPSNIMVGAHGEVLVMDWGIAKIQGAEPPVELLATELITPPQPHTQIGTVMGTHGYMAPEQLAG